MDRARTKNVLVFSTPSCSWCNTVKRYLKDHRIRFKEIDITRDQRAARDMINKTGQSGVPVILINGRPVVGFKKSELDRLLEIKRS